MSIETFWNRIEGALVKKDAREREIERDVRRFRFHQRLLVAGLGFAMLAAVGSGFYIFGVVLLSKMPI